MRPETSLRTDRAPRLSRSVLLVWSTHLSQSVELWTVEIENLLFWEHLHTQHSQAHTHTHTRPHKRTPEKLQSKKVMRYFNAPLSHFSGVLKARLQQQRPANDGSYRSWQNCSGKLSQATNDPQCSSPAVRIRSKELVDIFFFGKLCRASFGSWIFRRCDSFIASTSKEARTTYFLHLNANAELICKGTGLAHVDVRVSKLTDKTRLRKVNHLYQ